MKDTESAATTEIGMQVAIKMWKEKNVITS